MLFINPHFVPTSFRVWIRQRIVFVFDDVINVVVINVVVNVLIYPF